RQVVEGGFVAVVEEMIVETEQFVFGHVAENSRANVVDEMAIALAAAIVIDHDLQEIGFSGQFIVAAGGAENWIERIDVLDVEADLKVFAHRLDGGVHLCEHLMFAAIEEAIPGDDL